MNDSGDMSSRYYHGGAKQGFVADLSPNEFFIFIDGYKIISLSTATKKRTKENAAQYLHPSGSLRFSASAGSSATRCAQTGESPDLLIPVMLGAIKGEQKHYPDRFVHPCHPN